MRIDATLEEIVRIQQFPNFYFHEGFRDVDVNLASLSVIKGLLRIIEGLEQKSEKV